MRPTTLDTVEVKASEFEGGGNGLFTTRAFAKGDLLFSESPVVCQLKVHREAVKVCSQCLRFIGSFQEQMEHLRAAFSLTHRFQIHDAFTPPVVPCIPCRNGCGEVFCSQECEQEAWMRHHNLMCPSEAKRSDSVALAEYNAIDQQFDGNFLLLCGAKIVCLLLNVAQLEGCSVAEAKELAIPSHHSPLLSASFSQGDRKALCGQVVERPWALLQSILSAQQQLSDLLAPLDSGFFDSVLGMLRSNCSSVALPSPLYAYLDRFVAEAEAHPDALQQLVPYIQNISVFQSQLESQCQGQTPGVKGSAFYHRFSAMNHSCAGVNVTTLRPNTSTEGQPSLYDKAWVAVYADRALGAGCEVLNTYVDPSSSAFDRRQLLHSMFGFRCVCSLCASQGSCALGSCDAGPRDAHHACGRCKQVFYCSPAHQRAHWKKHKKRCKKN